MNKVLEVNEEYGYAIVEPGVSFFDLYDHIRKHNYKLMATSERASLDPTDAD